MTEFTLETLSVGVPFGVHAVHLRDDFRDELRFRVGTPDPHRDVGSNRCSPMANREMLEATRGRGHRVLSFLRPSFSLWLVQHDSARCRAATRIPGLSLTNRTVRNGCARSLVHGYTSCSAHVRCRQERSHAPDEPPMQP